jgi:Tol biopolymer transport system component
VGSSGHETDLLVTDLDRPAFTRLRTKGASLAVPVWTPDGTHLAYRSDQNAGRYNLFWRLADGTGEEALTKSSAYQTPAAWTPDGKVLAFYQDSDERPGTTIWLLSIADRNIRRLTQLDASETGADFSHDGRAIAYASNDSGQTQVYAQPYPGPGRRLSITSSGGYSPVWSYDNRTLFYLTNGPTPGEIQVMSVPVTTTPDLTVLGPSKSLFRGRYATNRGARTYDVTPDGRLLMVRPDDRKTPITEVVLVQNWTEELKRLMKGK